MGAPIMSSEALRQLRFSTLLRFAKASRDLHNHTVGQFGVAHWTRAVVSALGEIIDYGVIHPEEKVKVRIPLNTK